MIHPSLELEGIRKRFGETLALDDVSLQVRPGTVHALLGENGAGKTTLMRIAFGMLGADAGVVRRGGFDLVLRSPADAIAAGLGMVHQHFTLVPAMTVAENVALGGRGRYDPRDAARRVEAVGAAAGLVLDPGARAGDLPVAAQQRLEIIKALARNARTLILDEPTAVLGPTESRDLLAWVRRFASGEQSVVLITHKLRDALDVADDVTVLRRGRNIAVDDCSRTEAGLASAMLGERTVPQPSPAVAAATARSSGAVRIDARGAQVRDEKGVVRLQATSFTVSAGEILGVAGVDGSGHRELLRALARRLPLSAGDLMLPQTVAFVPEDRQRDALVLDAPLYENVALRDAAALRGLMPWSAIETRTTALLDQFDVRASSARSAARSLSGGNQQKLVLAREFDNAPDAIVAENPTRGLDIRATAEVHARLRAAARAGAAVVFYSSDLDEVIALSHRVLALSNGRGSVMAAERGIVGRAMLGMEISAASGSQSA